MPTATYIALANVTTSSAVSSVTFSSIPATYRDLVVVCNFIPTLNPVTDSFYIEFNGDTGSNYSYVRMTGNGSAAASATGSGASITGNAIGVMTYQQGNALVNIQDYSATDKHKTWLSRANFGWTSAFAGRWANTNAITSVKILVSGTTFQSGATFALYGIVS